MAVEEQRFPAAFFARLRAKPYIRGVPQFGASEVRVLSFGYGDRIRTLFEGCTLSSESVGENLTRRAFRCGDVSVIDIDSAGTQGRDAAALAEELTIVASGQREWGAPMRPSGFLSSAIGRRYGRDWIDARDAAPHAILTPRHNYDATTRSPTPSTTLPVQIAINAAVAAQTGATVLQLEHKTDVHALKHSLRAMFVARHMDAAERTQHARAYARGRAEGERSGRAEANAACEHAVAAAVAQTMDERERARERATYPVVVVQPPQPHYGAATLQEHAVPSQQNAKSLAAAECERTLKQVLASLDACTSARQTAFDAGMARGLDEAQRKH